MPAVHLDIPVPAFDTCFENPGCCYVKMECLPDGRLQEIHYLDEQCSVEKNIHNTNHSSAIFENGVCNKQGEHHFLTMKWDPKYCAPTHKGNLRSIVDKAAQKLCRSKFILKRKRIFEKLGSFELHIVTSAVTKIVKNESGHIKHQLSLVEV